jgi:hypothetical protein
VDDVEEGGEAAAARVHPSRLRSQGTTRTCLSGLVLFDVQEKDSNSNAQLKTSCVQIVFEQNVRLIHKVTPHKQVEHELVFF